MVVVTPHFSNFDRRFNQTFGYLPLRPPIRTRTGYSQEEMALFLRCLDRLEAARTTGAEVALINGSLLVDDGRRWIVPLEEVERRVQLVSRRACCERILPALAEGIGADEGGLYARYGRAGVYCLSSI